MRSVFFETIEPQLRWESDVRVPSNPDKVAVVAHWSLTAKVSRSFEELVRALSVRDYFVLISSACTAKAPLGFRAPLPKGVAVLRKPNLGYDFGSWAVGFLAQPQIFQANRVLQVNDSLLGPFWSIDPVIDDFEEDRGDLWGLVRSQQFRPHLQSYFVGFTPPVLRSQTFQDFWGSVRVEATKHDVIRRYELGLSERMYSEAFAAAAYLEPGRVGDSTLNPMINAWERVLELGVPFLKRELINDSSVTALGERIPELLKTRYDIDIFEWL